MAYESVKNQIDAYIKANGVNLITGPVLNAVLTTMLDELGEGYAFQGVLNTTDTPSPAADIPQAWLAAAGSYLGGSITVDEDELALIIHTADGWSKETVYRGVQLSHDAILDALGYTPADEADLAEKQDTIADLTAIRSGAALGETSVQPADIENMVEAEPIGSIIPPANPSEFATKEEVSQLRQEVDGIPRNYSEGHYLKNDGTIGDNADYGVTDFIPYTPGNAVLWKFDSANRTYYIGFYRADKTFISGSDFSAQYNAQNQGRLITTTQINSYAPNAAYIRASFTLAFTEAEVIVGDTSAWTPQEKQPSLQEKIDTLAEFNEDIFGTCFLEEIKLVGVYYQEKYIYKSDHSINDSTSNGSFIVPVTTGDKILVRGTINAFANYTVIGFTDDLTNGYNAGVKNLLTVNSNTNPYSYEYLFTATANGYLVAWSTQQEYGNTLYVEMFRLKDRQKEIYDRYLPESVKLQTFGDSVTDNTWGDKSSWVSYIPDNIKNTALTIVNSAVGGASIGGDGSYNIPHQIENGYTRTDGSVAAPLDSTADVVVIFAGTNDYAAGQTLDSVMGNLATSFQYIFEHSKAKVLFCTPLQRYNTTDQGFDTDSDGVPVNSQGYTLRELCDEIIKVCKRFSVSVLDLNAEANINRYNILDYSLDGLHPQRWGDAYVSRLICEKIKAMMRYDLQ